MSTRRCEEGLSPTGPELGDRHVSGCHQHERGT